MPGKEVMNNKDKGSNSCRNAYWVLNFCAFAMNEERELKSRKMRFQLVIFKGSVSSIQNKNDNLILLNRSLQPVDSAKDFCSSVPVSHSGSFHYYKVPLRLSGL